MHRVADRAERRLEAKVKRDVGKKVELKVQLLPNIKRIEVKADYLKYLRVARFWIRKKHGVSLPDLEMLLFLYSENIFTRKRFDHYTKIMRWDRARFGRMIAKGDIKIWRRTRGNEPALYELSFAMKSLMISFYKKLSGEEIISEANSPIYLDKNASCSNKAYGRMIKKVNKEIKESRSRPSQ